MEIVVISVFVFVVVLCLFLLDLKYDKGDAVILLKTKEKKMKCSKKSKK